MANSPDLNQVIVISTKTIHDLLKEENGQDALLLYNFYYYTCRFQKTNQIWAGREFVKRGLHWSTKRFSRAYKILENNNLVELVNANKIGSHVKWFVKVNKIWTKAKIETLRDGLGEPCHETAQVGHGLGEPSNALSENNIKCLKDNNFPKKASVKSQEYLGDSASTETLDTPNSPAPANRLFSLPEALTHEQTVWLTGESNLPVENDFWTDDVFPPFRAHTLSTNRTFKTEENFLFGVLAYGLNMDKRKF